MRNYIHRGSLRLREKIFLFDYILISLVLLLGIISIFAMYSTEQGKLGYYTQSHLYRFFIFFIFFIIVSFFKIKTWYKSAYLFYFTVLILLLAVDFFGISSSGSKRWISLFVFNLQPSELMKTALIVFLARYYYKIPSDQVTSIKYIIAPVFALSVPFFLVISQVFPEKTSELLILILKSLKSILLSL